jgi:hypothetical protein
MFNEQNTIKKITAGIVTVGLLSGAAGIIVGIKPRPAQAIPAFANKYDVPCAKCHTIPPRLTPFGYKFQRAGFRMHADPNDKPTDFHKAATFLAEEHAGDLGGGNNGFEMGDVSLLLGTSIGANLATRATLQFHKDGGPGFDEAWVQYNTAPSGKFWTVKTGQMPVLSGIRQTDLATFSPTDILMFGNVGALGDTDPAAGNFSLSGLERGVEVGYTDNAFTGRASWLNGVDESGDGTTPTTGNQGHDYALQADYLIGTTGSAVSGFYYSGRTAITTSHYDNKFNRSGAFASQVWNVKNGKPGIPDLALELYGGAMWGSDQVDAAGHRGNTKGALLETDLYSKHRTAYMARYDTVKASDIPGSSLNQVTTAYTFGVSSLLGNNVKASAEYRRQSGPDDHSMIGSLMFFY